MEPTLGITAEKRQSSRADNLPRRQAVQSLHPRASPLHRLASPATLTFPSILFVPSTCFPCHACVRFLPTLFVAHDPPSPRLCLLRSNFLWLVLFPFPSTRFRLPSSLGRQFWKLFSAHHRGGPSFLGLDLLPWPVQVLLHRAVLHTHTRLVRIVPSYLRILSGARSQLANGSQTNGRTLGTKLSRPSAADTTTLFKTDDLQLIEFWCLVSPSCRLPILLFLGICFPLLSLALSPVFLSCRTDEIAFTGSSFLYTHPGNEG